MTLKVSELGVLNYLRGTRLQRENWGVKNNVAAGIQVIDIECHKQLRQRVIQAGR